MSLVDTSAWVEYLRDTGSPACVRVGELLVSTRLIGASAHFAEVIARAVFVPLQPGDCDRAAALYRQCRSRGETVRVLVDCLIAALAIRVDMPVLHCDADFDALARHTPLRVEST